MHMKKPALLGGEPVRNQPYPPYNAIDAAAVDRAKEVLRSGLLSGFVARGNEHFLGGPVVRELESVLTEAFGTKFAVTVNSATSALHASLIAADIGPGDEVIVPPLTMSATAAAVMMCKATPIFADIEPATYCIDPASVEASISVRTKAIIAVNLFGLPSALRRLREIADRHGLVLIEDNAQAPGAKYEDTFAGTVGHMGVLSFNYHKVIHCGEGGAVLTSDERLALRLRLARNHGEVVLADWDEVDDRDTDIVGYNYRLTELQAALMISQVKRLAGLNQARADLAHQLTDQLGRFEFLAGVSLRDGCSHAYYLYPIRYFSHKLGISRDTFVAALAAERVHAAPYVKPIHHLPIFQVHRHASHPRFKRLFPGREQDLPIEPECCPVAVDLSYQSLMVTNICRPPNTSNEINEFVRAIDKIVDNIALLREWESDRQRAG